ncbi:MAG: hypothetical protein V2I46_12205 [Bacteroides sp.]|jgi:hypothetical protein|nr:hypothetical protein [Bacteroides sp.]
MKFRVQYLFFFFFAFLVSPAPGNGQQAFCASSEGLVFLPGEGCSAIAAAAPVGGVFNRPEAFESSTPDAGDEPEPEREKPFSPGLRGIVELGYFGIGGGNYDELKLGLSLGYQFNQFFLAGIGAGARKNLENSGALTYPFFAFLRVSSVEQKVTPYFMMGMGNFFKREEALEEGGLFLSSTLGAKLNLSKRTAMYLGLGIEIQNERWTSNNSAGLNLGLIF